MNQMSSTLPNPHRPLLQDVSQYEVDFVIPSVGVDLPMGIDPFLLFKSRDPLFADLHAAILDVFKKGICLIRSGQLGKARTLFAFPEVPEIGLGYTEKGKQGSGLGKFLSELLIETLSEAPALLERGIRHIEEMQLVSIGIGPDRVSDISANLLKRFLIEYTQKQCTLWSLPTASGAPVEHVFDFDSYSWYDGYFDLPLSPLDSTPMLFVPRRIVRLLPWINYEDFFRMEFSSYLRAKRVRGRLGHKGPIAPESSARTKNQVVAVTRMEVDRIDRYVSSKEASASQAQPSLDYLNTGAIDPEAQSLKDRLYSIKPGREQAADYQHFLLQLLNFLFTPDLIDGEMEVKTIDGTERRDILFTNDSDKSFWTYLRNEHSAVLLMFEAKNTHTIDNMHLNQTATYLGDRIGRLGFVVTRNALREAQTRKVFSIYNDSHPRKIIITLTDDDLLHMIDMRASGSDPMRHLQKMYRAFRSKVQ